MKKALSILMLIAVVALAGFTSEHEKSEAKSIHEFTVKNIDGKKVKLEDFKGKVLLIVNVASKCGFTPQYKDLVALHDQFEEQGFSVLGFPANDFGKQEPGTNEEIKEFCQLNYNVDFPMFTKVVVKGKEKEPLFQYLTTAENPDFKGDIGWNFEKFLISKDGKLLHRYRSKVVPTSDEIVQEIKKTLKSQ